MNRQEKADIVIILAALCGLLGSIITIFGQEGKMTEGQIAYLKYFTSFFGDSAEEVQQPTTSVENGWY